MAKLAIFNSFKSKAKHEDRLSFAALSGQY